MVDASDADRLRPSLLDRLIGDEPGTPRGVYGYIGLRELRESVARDLEWLLNSKRWLPYDLEEFPEANDSALTYGVPDFSTYSWRNPGDADQIARLIEDTVRRFEPRLAPNSIKVELLPSGAVDDFKLSFRIDAVLHVEPVHEAVSYDTEMDLESTAIRINRSS